MGAVWERLSLSRGLFETKKEPSGWLLCGEKIRMVTNRPATLSGCADFMRVAV
jgi:hypothetical protein